MLVPTWIESIFAARLAVFVMSNTVMSVSLRLTYPAVGNPMSVGNSVVVGRMSVLVSL